MLWSKPLAYNDLHWSHLQEVFETEELVLWDVVVIAVTDATEDNT